MSFTSLEQSQAFASILFKINLNFYRAVNEKVKCNLHRLKNGVTA